MMPAVTLAVGLLLGALIEGAPARGQTTTSPLLAELEAEFKDRQFATKITVASYLRYYAPEAGRDVMRLIDTEVLADGSVRYLVRRGHVDLYNPLAPSRYIAPNQITAAFSPGTVVTVHKVEIKGDRVELWLRGPASGYGKLKLMFGKGFQKAIKVEGILPTAGRALRLERLERAPLLERQYEELTLRLGPLRRDWENPPQVAALRLGQALEFQRVLESLRRNRSEYALLTRSPTSPDLALYGDLTQEVGRQLPEIQEAARREQIAELKAAVVLAAREVTAIKAKLGTRAASRTEWDARKRLLEDWRRAVDHRRDLHEQLTAVGEPVSAAEQEQLRVELREIDDWQRTLDADRQRIDLVELDAEYRELARQRPRFLDGYTRAYGTPRQREAASELLAHLTRMQENREAAQLAGSSAAGGQAVRIKSEIDRVRRQ